MNPHRTQAHTFLTKEEKELLRQRAKSLGLSDSAYLRQLFLKDANTPRPVAEAISA